MVGIKQTGGGQEQYRKWRSQRTYMYDPQMYKGGALLEGMGVLSGGGRRTKKWDNCNSIINKKYLKKKE